MIHTLTERCGAPRTNGKRSSPIGTIVAMLLGMLISGVMPGRAAEFRLRAECRSPGALVRLGDVAEVFAADRRQADALAAIELFPVPPPPQQRFVRLREIQDLLLLRGVNLAEHRFSGSSQVAILGGGGPARSEPERALSPSAVRKAHRRIRDALVQYLQEHVSADRPWNVEVELSKSQAHLVSGTVRSISIAGGSAPWTGTQRFEVVVASPDGPVQFSLDAQVAVPPPVVVTVSSLPRGVVVRAADVELRDPAPRDGQFEAFYAIDEVVGKETTRAIPKGKVLQRESVRSPLLVQRGEVVTVYARSPGIRVETKARARQHGGLGDLVAVESLLDRKTYFARVSAVREVEVYARSPRIATSPQSQVARRHVGRAITKGIESEQAAY